LAALAAVRTAAVTAVNFEGLGRAKSRAKIINTA